MTTLPLHPVLQDMLDGELVHPGTQAPVQLHVHQIVCAESLQGRETELLYAYAEGKNVALVCDEATYDALGRRIEQALEALSRTTTLIGLAKRPKADQATVKRICKAAAGCDLYIAAGSGTVHDLTKAASHADRVRWLSFPTAPSMNGYLSANASLSIDGYKESVPAQLPHAMFIDLDVLCHAPKQLIRAGLGDSLCRSTVQADGLLAHALTDAAYDPFPFSWTNALEEAVLDNAGLLIEHDREAIKHLMEWLLLSGAAMTHYGNSTPASQGEHLIAHLMGMALGADAPATLHGEEIAVTTLTMHTLQSQLLEGDAPILQWKPAHGDALAQLIGEQAAELALKQYAKKGLDEEGIASLNTRIEAMWEDIVEDIAAVRRPYEQIQEAYAAVGLPQTPGALGWSSETYTKVVKLAPLIRDRFTFLDMQYCSRSIA